MPRNNSCLTLKEILEKYSDGPVSGVFTDGSARPNPGPGGWGYVWVESGEIIKQNYGSDQDTTNNRMELTALREALSQLPLDSEIEVYSDSDLCVKTFNIWANSWEKRGWKKSGGPIKNLELVKEVYFLYKQRPKVKIKWIEAHNGWLWNEYADSLSTAWTREKL